MLGELGRYLKKITVSNSIVDENDLKAKLSSTLRDFSGQFGKPPAMTAILFEPHHQCWGIYHSPREMSRDDSPGDYEVQNAEVGDMPLSASEYQRPEMIQKLRDIGRRLIRSVDEKFRPAGMGIELDYDRVYTFPDDDS